ncbi:hypothetical protein, partial [Clostridium perfringens]|uniref:hypothetical protein n=1 Tax=Clostridium perfringens TaxID=1502 RepID=UPI003F909114
MDLIIYKLISNIGLKITLWYKITSRTDLSYESKIKNIFEKRGCIKINFDISREKGGFINLNPPFCIYYCYEKHSS